MYFYTYSSSDIIFLQFSKLQHLQSSSSGEVNRNVLNSLKWGDMMSQQEFVLKWLKISFFFILKCATWSFELSKKLNISLCDNGLYTTSTFSQTLVHWIGSLNIRRNVVDLFCSDTCIYRNYAQFRWEYLVSYYVDLIQSYTFCWLI